MNSLDPILRDLRERKLWPIALLLLAALVTIPMLLSRASQAAPSPVAVSAPSAAASRATALPALSVTSVPAHSRLGGHARDPFAQQKLKAGPPAKRTKQSAHPSNTLAKKKSSGSAGTGAKTTGGTSPSGTGWNGSSGGSRPAGFPAAPARPAPSGLAGTQSYRVALAMTNSAGGTDTSDPLERLSVLPNEQEPLLVELGVLRGGRRVLFAVEPQALLSGPGICTPGPVDCEIMSLAPGQIEQLSMKSASGPTPVTQFAVTAISVDRHASSAAANLAREQESAAGRRLLQQSALSALSLFAYRPNIGAVVDLRNLTLGGN